MAESSNQPRSLRERLDELYRRLRDLPRAATANEALQQLCDTLEQVEDEYSGVARQTPPPAPTQSDGRMYGPQTDFVLQREDGSILAMTRGHRIEIAPDGGLKVINKLTGLAEFEK